MDITGIQELLMAAGAIIAIATSFLKKGLRLAIKIVLLVVGGALAIGFLMQLLSPIIGA